MDHFLYKNGTPDAEGVAIPATFYVGVTRNLLLYRFLRSDSRGQCQPSARPSSSSLP